MAFLKPLYRVTERGLHLETVPWPISSLLILSFRDTERACVYLKI